MGLAAHWENILLWVSIVSAVVLTLTLLMLPWAVTSLPADYFTRPRRHSWRDATNSTSINLVLVIAKNLLGLVLALLGIAMLFTPGQGVLTLIAGVALMNFPGKYTLERKLVLGSGALQGINWMRQKRGYPPMEAPKKRGTDT